MCALNIGIIDYGMGNLHSIYRRVSLQSVNPFIVHSPVDLRKADKIILPGVGHFEKAVKNLKVTGLFDALNEAVLLKKIPVLGICLGMQLFANKSEEGNAEGFGWINTEVKRFNIKDNIKYKVPQAGWNTITKYKESNLFKNIDDHSEFYFLHSFHYATLDQKYILTKTNYEYEFISSLEKDNIFGTQFHPEKSHDNGSQLINNFIKL
ncbi:imidazole glycerol phosphate synthase subunit HisH [Rufibacter soli]